MITGLLISLCAVVIYIFIFFICQSSREEDDDFLYGETHQTDGIVGITPGSYDSNLRSPGSMGSPSITFQRPF